MKQAVILHAFEQDPKGHWYPWLKNQLELNGYTVWIPNLPHNPNSRETTKSLLSDESRDFNDNLVIGHSMGAVQMLSLLQNLPEDQALETAVLVSAFKEATTRKFDWALPLKGLFVEPFDFNKIKIKARNFLFVHGDNDPYCDPQDAKWLAAQVGAEFVSVKDGQHFSSSIDPKYHEFPKLIELLEKRNLL